MGNLINSNKNIINRLNSLNFFEPLEKEISVEDMQKIMDANEKLVKDLKDNEHSKL